MSPALAGKFFTTSTTRKVKVTQSCPTLYNPMDYVAHQVPLSMGFSRPEYWGGLPFPSPGDLPTQGLKPRLPHCRQTPYHLGKPKEMTQDGNSNPQKQVKRTRNGKMENAVITNLVFFLQSASLKHIQLYTLIIITMYCWGCDIHKYNTYNNNCTKRRKSDISWWYALKGMCVCA